MKKKENEENEEQGETASTKIDYVVADAPDNMDFTEP